MTPDNSAKPRTRFRFPRRSRLVSSVAFEQTLRAGVRGNNGLLTVWMRPNGLAHARFGVIVGRRLGNAVRRSRIKRVLRSAFRLAQHDLPPGFDIVCTPRAHADLTVRACMDALVRLAARLAKSGA